MNRPGRKAVSALKSLLRKALPPGVHPTDYLYRLVRRRTNLIVAGGPFRGLQYVDRAVGSALYPKLLGIYEAELLPCVRRIADLGIRSAVDIGAAEGYYAVGLLFARLVARVVAFEETEEGRMLMAEMARLNAVSGSLTVMGRCEPDTLQSCLVSLEGPTVVVCDVEGYENVLMDPALVPALAQVSILVELHEFACRGITATVSRRFKDSHSIIEIVQRPRTRGDFPYRTPFARVIPERYLRAVISEYRPEPMNWLWMEPLADIAVDRKSSLPVRAPSHTG